MTDTALIAALVETTLRDLAKQASALGVGLQNVAPSEKTASPNNSVQYLFDVSESLLILAKDCRKLLPTSNE